MKESTTLYLDIDDYNSCIDIYSIHVDKDSVSFSVEYDIQFTYVDELCKWLSQRYSNTRFIIPDKFYKATSKYGRDFIALSYAVRLDKYHIVKLLVFRASIYKERRHAHTKRYPQYYLHAGYTREYAPIARDEKPYTGTLNMPHWL